MIVFILIGNAVVGGILISSWLIANRAVPKAVSSDHAPPRRSMHLFQIACQIVLTVIALVPLVFLNILLIGAPFQTVTYNGLGRADNAQLQNQADCTDLSGVELALTIRSLDSAQDTANVDITLCVGDQVLRNLTVEGSGARPFSKGFTVSRINMSFWGSAFRVSYEGSLPETSLTRTVTIQSILEQSNPSALRGPVDLGVISMPVLGNVVSYPFDSYSMAGLWVVSPPPGMAVTSSEGIRFSWAPPPLAVATTPDAGNLAWHWGDVQSLGDVIEASRILPIKAFVFLIAGLPLLLFIGLLALIRPVVADADRRRFPAELLAGVGAFLLAIIPVRTVLVPTDISQITVTDYILGAEMAVIVAASLIIVSGRSMNPRRTATGIPAKDAPHYSTDAAAESETPSIIDSAVNRLSVHRMQPRKPFIARALLGLVGAVTIVGVRQVLNRMSKSSTQ
jgi:hypothetical protein